MRTTQRDVASLLLLVVGGLAGLGCSGVVVPEPPSAGMGSSSGGSADSGSAGEPDVGVLPGRDGGEGVEGGTVSPPTCAPGATCHAGDGCASSAASGGNACAESCKCDATGHFQCVEECVDASPPTGCQQGATCSANTGCGGGSTGGGCTFSCACDTTGHLQCRTSCPPPVDAGGDARCVQNVLCIMGDHWDPTQCRCVPDACVSSVGGPCSGFVANPCQCAPGLVCVASGIPDVGGTCQAQRSCCPINWDLYSCTGADGGAGLNCHDPARGCASSSTCGGGCDSQVTGPCPVCDPIPCPSGETFDATQCKCVAPAAPSCNTATDCTGILPALCEVCADGGAGCAHWSCVGGQCQTAFCQ